MPFCVLKWPTKVLLRDHNLQRWGKWRVKHGTAMGAQDDCDMATVAVPILTTVDFIMVSKHLALQLSFWTAAMKRRVPGKGM